MPAPSGEVSWIATNQPAANTRATVTKAAAATGIRNVVTAITVMLVATATAPTAVQLRVDVIDGASGGTTYLWQAPLALTATPGASTGIVLDNLWLGGTPATALTIEFTVAGGANTVEGVWMSGVTVRE